MEFPNVVAYAIPLFLVLVVLEVFAWQTGRGARYETRDAAVSLTMGFGNFAIAAPFAVVLLAAFEVVHRFTNGSRSCATFAAHKVCASVSAMRSAHRVGARMDRDARPK